MYTLKNIKKGVVTLLAVCFIVTNSYSQDKINRTGKVVNASGEGLPNVAILIENSATGTLTDQNGTFQIRTLNNEVLAFRKIGYLVKEVSINGKTDLGNIKLEINTDQSEITGTVSDVGGMPLIGATVVIRGTSEGTATDFDGGFSIRASVGDELVVSYVGYKPKTIKIVNNNPIQVTLEDDSALLDEVVVTAFAIKREKKSLGYSVQQVNADEINESKENSVAYALQGRVAGLQISRTGAGAGASSKITLRGISSLTGNSSPLIVIDGIPMDNSTPNPRGNNTGNISSQDTSNFDYGDGLGNINQEDIESISVLKGPNAAGLYGTRGANGVILITTKKGKSKAGLGISYSSAISIETPFVFPELQNSYGVGSGGQFPIADNGNGIPSSFGALNIPSWGPELNGQQYQNWNGKTASYTPGGDTLNDFYGSGYTATNSLSINGGNEQTTFYVSLSNLTNEGIVPGSTFKRNNISIRASHKLSDKLSIDGKVSYIKQNADNRATGGASPFNSFSQLIGLSRDIKIDDLKNNYIDLSGNPVSPYRLSNENPYWIVNRFKNEDSRDRIIGSLALNYSISDRLSFVLRSGIDTYFDNRFVRIPKNSQSLPIGNLVFTDFSLTEMNTDFLLKYDSKRDQDFTYSASVGGNLLNRKTHSNQTSGSDLKVPSLDNITNASRSQTEILDTEREIQSFYGFAQFGYKNFLYLDLTGRNDWSSVLPSQNRSFFYPSATSTLILSSLFDLPKFVNLFKIRGSWAQAGSDGSQLYQDRLYLSLIGNPAANGAILATLPGTLPNLDLKNELTTSIEYGAELVLFKNRVSMDVTLYQSETENQIITSPVSITSGFGFRIFNAGKIENKGIEASLKTVPIRSNDFEWNLNFNFSKNKNTVIELDDAVSELVINNLAPTSVSSVTIKTKPGEPFGNIYGRDFLRNERGELLLNGQGLPQATPNEVLLGNAQPDWFGSISNTFTYKGFSLSGLIEFSQGGEFYSETKARLATNGNSKETLANRDELFIVGTLADNSANTTTTTAQKYYEQLDGLNIAAPFIEDASYIALRELAIGYSLPKKILENTFLTSAKISAYGRNLGYLQRKATHIAPEAILFSPRSNDIGIEFLPLPLTRNVGLKLNVEF
tara:strand:+ start:3193 stop:6573 length:3381 start_codon:yes stop_codon:yes gene_type:complete